MAKPMYNFNIRIVDCSGTQSVHIMGERLGDLIIGMTADDYKTIVDTGEKIEADGDRAATSVEARDLLLSKRGIYGLFIVRAKMDTFVS